MVRRSPIKVSHGWTRLISSLWPQRPSHLLTCPLPVSHVHGHHLGGRSRRFIHSSSTPEAAACASLQERSPVAVFRSPELCFSSCRLSSDRHKLQNSPDLLGCLKGRPKLSLFFPNPNSLRLLSLPAHACRSYPHSRVRKMIGGEHFSRVTLKIKCSHTWTHLRQSFRKLWPNLTNMHTLALYCNIYLIVIIVFKNVRTWRSKFFHPKGPKKDKCFHFPSYSTSRVWPIQMFFFKCKNKTRYFLPSFILSHILSNCSHRICFLSRPAS